MVTILQIIIELIPDFEYKRQFVKGNDLALEFVGHLGGEVGLIFPLSLSLFFSRKNTPTHHLSIFRTSSLFRGLTLSLLKMEKFLELMLPFALSLLLPS